MGGKRTVTFHGAPRGWKAYIQWSAAWFSKGIIYDTVITTPVPCSLQHTFQFGLGRTEPCWPARVMVTLKRVSPPPVTTIHVTQGTNPHNPEVRTRGWIYGRHQNKHYYTYS